MSEARFKNSCHYYLDPACVYRQSMTGTQTGGTPDNYYELVGSKEPHSLWVEWKWTASRNPRVLPQPTTLQINWLQRAHNNGQLVAVIIGCPVKAWCFSGSTLDLYAWTPTPQRASAIAETRRDVADWIVEHLTHRRIYNG